MADVDSRKGHGYGSGALLDWVNELHAHHDAALLHAFHSPEKHGMPAIQVGPSEGKTLELLLRLVAAKKVVEVGTLAGYSAVRMARVLPPGGHLWTVEFDAKHAHVARENIAVAKMTERVTVVEGAGADVLPTLEKHGPFDAVFIDADKRSYDVYGRWAAQHLRRGGLLIGDNVYLFGRLLEESDEAAAMRRFHEEAREAFDTVVIPTPDGLLLGVKR